jgi:hypothetical protein
MSHLFLSEILRMEMPGQAAPGLGWSATITARAADGGAGFFRATAKSGRRAVRGTS